MICNLISDDNGVGLTTEMRLLEGFLVGRGHIVNRVQWDAKTTPRADINFYLEKLEERHLNASAKHVAILNLEWFDESKLGLLNYMDQIWAKSAAAFEWFKERNLDAIYTGFLSKDRYDYRLRDNRSMSALHIAGASQAKGTTEVLQAYWKCSKELPELTVVSKVAIEPLPPNVVCLTTVCESFLNYLINRSMIHLCPSRVEGFGHYITDGTSSGAFVITTDASPMNEHVTATTGRLLDQRDDGTVDPDQIVEALKNIARMSRDALLSYEDLARRRWRQRQQKAHRAMSNCMEWLEC